MYCVDSGDSIAAAHDHRQVQPEGQGRWLRVGRRYPRPAAGAKSELCSSSIDQQAYLQGFVPTVQLFLYSISAGLMKPCNTDTGLGSCSPPPWAPTFAHHPLRGQRLGRDRLRASFEDKLSSSWRRRQSPPRATVRLYPPASPAEGGRGVSASVLKYISPSPRDAGDSRHDPGRIIYFSLRTSACLPSRQHHHDYPVHGADPGDRRQAKPSCWCWARSTSPPARCT